MIEQVVCVRDDWGHKPNLRCWPIVGGVYTIRASEMIKAISAEPPMLFYRFEEILNPLIRGSRSGSGDVMEPVFDASWFRPVRRTSIDEIKRVALPAGFEPALTA